MIAGNGDVRADHFDVSTRVLDDVPSMLASKMIASNVNIESGPRQFVNVDVKPVWIKSPVYADAVKETTVYINPLLVGACFGFRF